MRRMRQLAVALAALAVALPAPAAALAPSASGWWWRAQAGLPVDVPAPPQVPEGGLYVEGAPDGPSSVSALALRVPSGMKATAITLTVADERGGDDAVLLACPAASLWTPAQAGAWDDRPQASCEGRGILGVRAEDGSQWTFALGAQAFSGTRDYVFMAGQDPSRPEGFDGAVFSIAFQPPDDRTVSTAAVPADDSGPPPQPPYQPEPDQRYFAPPFTESGGDNEAAAGPQPQAAPSPDPSVITPRRTVPAGQAPAQAPAGAGRDARTLATLVALLSVGVAGVLSRDHAIPLPAGLRAMQQDDQEREGGIGRFRRRRSAPPPPL